MGILKFLLTLAGFVFFAPIILFSIGAMLVILWSVISFILPLIVPIVLIALFIAVIIGIYQAQKELKRKEKFYKAVNKDKVPSQFYLY